MVGPVEVRHCPGYGNGVTAEEAMPRGKCILRIPGSLCLHRGSPLEDPGALGAEFQSLRDLPDPHILYLAAQRALGEQSLWWPYVGLLPDPIEGLLRLSKRQQFRLIKGTPLHALVTHKRRCVYQNFARARAAIRAAGPRCETLRGLLHDGRLSLGLYRWAYMTFWARVFFVPAGLFGVTTGQNPSEGIPALVPFYDLMNHCLTPNTEHTFAVVGTVPAIEVSLLGEVPAAQELRCFYADISNERLLFQYGFTLEHNPHEAVLFDRCMFQHTVTFEDERRRVLRSLGFQDVFFVTHTTDICRFHLWVRICCLAAGDGKGLKVARRLAAKSNSCGHLPPSPLPGTLSRRNTRDSQRILIGLLWRRLRGVAAVDSHPEGTGVSKALVADISRYREGQATLLRSIVRRLHLTHTARPTATNDPVPLMSTGA